MSRLSSVAAVGVAWFTALPTDANNQLQFRRLDDTVGNPTTSTLHAGAKSDLAGAKHNGTLLTHREKKRRQAVAKLVARNDELERLISKLRESKNRGEHISVEQLDLFVDKLRELAAQPPRGTTRPVRGRDTLPN